MTNKQISTFLNGAIKSNMLGENSLPIAEDMSNYIDYGKALSTLSVADLEDFKNRLVAQIRNYVVTRTLERKDFKMFKDSIEYGGALQRILSKGVLSTEDSEILSLIAGKDYTNNKYYGADISSKLYTNVDSFMCVFSISSDDWRLAFTNVEDMRRVIGIIYNAEQNTINAYLNQLSKRLFIAMIENCKTNNRKIDLLTKFNDLTGGTYTIDQIRADRKLYAYFSDFVKGVVSKVKTYMQEPNIRYNSGEDNVQTWTPSEDIEVVMISDFINDIRYLGNPVDFNVPSMNVEEISCWQSTNDAMLPTLNDVSLIKLDSGDIDNVVGLIYDRLSVGIENVADVVTSGFVPAGNFTNYFHHMSNRYFMDTRFGSVILTLD